MRRVIALALGFGIVASLVAMPAVASAKSVTSYVTVSCFIDWTNPYWRPTGRNGQVEHDGAVITWDVWVYDAAGWRSVGTEVDTVMDESNSFAGIELFRGSFSITSTIGDFVGTFMWTETPNGARGQGTGHAVDGSGQLWKFTANVVDPATTGLPECAGELDPPFLGRLDIVTP